MYPSLRTLDNAFFLKLETEQAALCCSFLLQWTSGPAGKICSTSQHLSHPPHLYSALRLCWNQEYGSSGPLLETAKDLSASPSLAICLCSLPLWLTCFAICVMNWLDISAWLFCWFGITYPVKTLCRNITGKRRMGQTVLTAIKNTFENCHYKFAHAMKIVRLINDTRQSAAIRQQGIVKPP